MELRHLRYFVVVAEELHFGRAAARLHLAQPPLSQQIRQLEQELGVELLHRTTRKVSLTEAGKLFLGDAQRILRNVDQAKRSALRAHNGELGRLVLAFLSSSAHDVMPILLRAYRRRFPDVELILNEMENSVDGLAALNSASVHASILRPPIDDEELRYEIIAREPFIVALPEEHYLAERGYLTLADLAAEPFIVFRRRSGTTLYDGIISQCRQIGFSPRVVQELTGVTSIVCLVAAGVGISVLPASVAMRHTIGVVHRELHAPGLVAELALAWRRDDASSVVRGFLDVAREVGPLQAWPRSAPAVASESSLTQPVSDLTLLPTIPPGP